MKIKLSVSHAKYDSIKTQLIEHGIEVDNDSCFVLIEENHYSDFIMGKKDGELSPVPIKEIVFVETFGSDVLMHTGSESYYISERLIRLESMLDPSEFLRVSNSAIVSLKRIKKIRPTFSSKFILTMDNGSKVDVTRSYYARFKEFFGL